MSSSESSDDSCASSGSNDAKMQAMLAEWDVKDSSENVYVDSDSENASVGGDDAKKMALLKSADSDDDDAGEVEDEVTAEEVADAEDSESDADSDEEEASDEGEESGEDDESEDDADDEDEEEDEVEEKAETAVAPSGGDDDDEADVVDDGNIEDTLKKKPKKKKEKVKLAPLTAVTDDDNEEDAAMKALLNEWGGDDDNEEDDDDSDDDEEDSEASEREVQLDDNVIDHIVLAAPDLDEAMADFEKMTGIGAVIAGSINGLGIKCARISFNDSSYIEIIAPDPKQNGPIGQLLKTKGIKELTPFHFAIRSSKAEELKDEVKQFGYVPDHITMFGGKKDGTPRKWEMLYLYGHKMGGICPFFINWSNSDHPCATLPVVGKLKKFTIRAPEDDPVHELLAHVGAKGFNVEVGKTKLSFQFSSPEGTVKFATSKAVGFKFPGFDDEEHDLDACASDDDEVVFEAPAAPELLTVGEPDYEDLPAPAY